MDNLPTTHVTKSVDVTLRTKDGKMLPIRVAALKMDNSGMLLLIDNEGYAWRVHGVSLGQFDVKELAVLQAQFPTELDLSKVDWVER